MVITKLLCRACNRYLGQAIGSAKIDELICAKCKHRNRFDIRVRKEKSDDK